MRSKKITEKELSQLPISGKQPSSEKEEKYLREVGEFEFYNLEEPGLMHKFSYGDTKFNHAFTFFHGMKYRVPRFIARHLESCGTPIWDWRPDGSGKMQKQKVGNKPRFRMSEVFN